jgi:hypothetical protein
MSHLKVCKKISIDTKQNAMVLEFSVGLLLLLFLVVLLVMRGPLLKVKNI